MNSSLATNDPARANGRLVATQSNGEVRPLCVVCRTVIADHQWFCRLPQNGNGPTSAEGNSMLLCSPRCALRHFSNGDDHVHSLHQRYDHVFEFILDGKAAA